MFPKTTFATLLTLFAFVAQSPRVHAEPGARTVRYAEADVIPIRAKIRFSTLIVLPANEEILDATTGDKEFWIINGAHNLCYLHPAEPGIRSNLNLITTTGHVYSFLLTEVSKEPTTLPDLKVFVEREEESSVGAPSAVAALARASEVEAYKTAADSARAEATLAVQAAESKLEQQIHQYRAQYPGKLAFDYRYSAKAIAAPFFISAIYHDDKFTYIKSAASEKPTIYELKDGKPNLINFDLENGTYVIPKIVGQGYMVLGKKKLPFARHGAGS